MASLFRRRGRAPLSHIDIRVPQDTDDDDDDNDEGRRLTPTPTQTVTKSPLSTPSSPAKGTLAGQTSTQHLITTVTAPAQTTIVTKSVIVSAIPVTVTVVATPSPAASGTSGPTGNAGVDGGQAQGMNTTMGSAAPIITTTGSAPMSGAVISGPGAAFIGGVGAAARLSVLSIIAIIILRRKK